MSNKTALDIAIDDLQESVNRMRSMPTTGYISGAHDANVRIIKLLKELKEKEKQQIMKSYNDGYSNCTWDLSCKTEMISKEEYFNSKYGNLQEDQETKQ